MRTTHITLTYFICVLTQKFLKHKQFCSSMAELTEEDLKNMSPEQIAALQKQQCIFCHIIDGKVPAKKVYEDDKVIGILDINPAAAGHVLLIPKEHYAIMPHVPPEVLSHIAIIGKQLSQAMLKNMKAEGTNFFVANGMVAGQRAPHFMMHIIPRKSKDGVNITIQQHTIQQKDMQKVISALTGKTPEKKEKIKKTEDANLDDISKLLGGT
jgi:histidine triad (HIT) family protein